MTKKKCPNCSDAINLTRLEWTTRGFACPRCSCIVIRTVSPLVMAAVLFSVLLLIIPFIRAKSQKETDKRNYLVCRNNLKKIASALEKYAGDNDNRYPKKLSQLAPYYMKAIPTCLAAEKDTYGGSYKYQSGDPKKDIPDVYTFYCEGHYHKSVGVSPNYPQYNSITGLIPK